MEYFRSSFLKVGPVFVAVTFVSVHGSDPNPNTKDTNNAKWDKRVKELVLNTAYMGGGNAADQLGRSEWMPTEIG